MEREQLDFTVNAVSRVHPISIVINLLFVGVLLSGLYGLFFDNKALYGVVIYIFVGLVARVVLSSLLKLYLRSKYRGLLNNDSEA
jgi:uncharacterized membrane protein YuzA (DUF378 family)